AWSSAFRPGCRGCGFRRHRAGATAARAACVRRRGRKPWSNSSGKYRLARGARLSEVIIHAHADIARQRHEGGHLASEDVDQIAVTLDPVLAPDGARIRRPPDERADAG